MNDKNLYELLPIEMLLKESPQEVRGIYINEYKTLYTALEGLIDYVLDDDPRLDFDRASKALQETIRSMDDLFEHLFTYLKARKDLKNG